tara:strand:+ start:4584 stop:5105 length:522 start_codon:yes stop_codon:yes gene_type:complete
MFQKFIIFTGFQVTWFACVFGEYFNFPLTGVFVGIIYLFIFFLYINNKLSALKICIFFSIIGYSFDSFLSINKLFVINSNLNFGFLPIWFLILWPCFTTLFINVLTFLKGRIFLSFILGSLFVPPSYLIGISLDIAESRNIFLTLSIMIFFWGFFMSFYSNFLSNSFLKMKTS